MDNLSKEQRTKNMKNIRSKNTTIEIKLRNALWKEGFRYRKNYNALPGTPDIALTKYRIAIFCDSEFWHGKDWDVLKPRLEKSNNSNFWISKISRNREHDAEVDRKLMLMDWTVVRFWGKDILNNTQLCITIIKEIIEDQVLEDNLDYDDETK